MDEKLEITCFDLRQKIQLIYEAKKRSQTNKGSGTMVRKLQKR